jgi:HPt (histidine-containing phosphotransfer) domain-containing protein
LKRELLAGMNENKSKSEDQNSEQISLDNLSTLLNGSKEQMIRMTEVFLDQIEKHFNELKFALNENDVDQITAITHKLKSSFKLFGMNKTGVLLERIEQRAKTLNRDELNSELHLVLNMQPRLTYLLQKELNQLILSNSNS